MDNKSFSEFYYSKDKKIHDLREVQEEYENNSGNINKFKDHMFCPECKVAKLSFTHKTSKKRAFLSKLPSSSHEEYCAYINDYATEKEIHQWVSSPISTSQIKDRLEATLNTLLNNNRVKVTPVQSTQEVNPFVITLSNKNYNKVYRKSIPRKSINSWFDKSDENITHIFYGTVKLEVKEIKPKDAGKVFYKLLIKTKRENEWKTKTTIFRLHYKDNVDINVVYDIALLGHIEFYNDFPQLKIANFDSILFRKRKINFG